MAGTETFSWNEWEQAEASISAMETAIEQSAENISEMTGELADSLSGYAELAARAWGEMQDSMLDSEKFYLSEKRRLETENTQMDEHRRALEYQKRLAAARTSVQAEIVKEGEILRQKKLADAQYLQELKDAAETEKAVLKQLKDDIKKIYGEIADYAEENIGSVYRAQEKLEKKMSDYGKMTKNVIFKHLGPNRTDLVYPDLTDTGKQVEILKNYAQAIEEVKTRMTENGFSKENAQAFFGTMTELSFEEGEKLAKLLTEVSEEDFKTYLSNWVEKERLAEELSKELYREPFEEAVDATRDYMEEKLSAAGLQIPEGFFVSGTLSAERFGEAFCAELAAQMEKVRELAEGFSLGGQSLSQITSGNSAYYNTTYVLNGSGETVAEQLMAARNYNELERMRNG